jgi:peroxiredoxin Q/BCP
MSSAAAFSLPDQHNTIHSLAGYAGKWLVLYFYPKDETPGCTAEACAFRDGRDLLQEAGAEVVGVSQDSVASHKTFADKHNLSFTLLSDESAQTVKAYGALGEADKTLRKTFLIDPTGEIVKEYPDVTPSEHVLQVWKDLRELQQA